MSWTIRFGGALLVCALAVTAHGQLQISSIDQTVDASTYWEFTNGITPPPGTSGGDQDSESVSTVGPHDLHAGASSSESVTEPPSTTWNRFNGSGSAQLNSNASTAGVVLDTGAWASGFTSAAYGDGGHTFGRASAQSSFSMTFTVPAPTEVELRLFMEDFDAEVYDDWTSGTRAAILQEDGNDLYRIDEWSNDWFTPIHDPAAWWKPLVQTFVLQPGHTYTYSVSSSVRFASSSDPSHSGGGYVKWTQADLVVIPEPASLSLLVLGAVSLWRRR